jgi:hypothetical protein
MKLVVGYNVPNGVSNGHVPTGKLVDVSQDQVSQ